MASSAQIWVENYQLNDTFCVKKLDSAAHRYNTPPNLENRNKPRSERFTWCHPRPGAVNLNIKQHHRELNDSLFPRSHSLSRNLRPRGTNRYEAESNALFKAARAWHNDNADKMNYVEHSMEKKVDGARAAKASLEIPKEDLTELGAGGVLSDKSQELMLQTSGLLQSFARLEQHFRVGIESL